MQTAKARAGNIFTVLSDAQLVTQFQLSKDNQVFGELYCRYVQKVNIYCRKALGDEQRADDAAQDVFIRAFEKLHTLKNPQVWVAWLFCIARNLLLNLHKQNKRYRVEPEAAGYLIADEISNFDKMNEEECQLAALPKLLDGSASGRILRLKYVEGRSIDELCVELCIKKSAVKMRLLRARQTVADLYYSQVALG